MTVAVRYAPKANAAYLRLSQSEIVESEEVSEGVVLDFDAAGHIVGVEILNARRLLPADSLIAAE